MFKFAFIFLIGKSVDNAGVVGESTKLHGVFGICTNPNGEGIFGTNNNGFGGPRQPAGLLAVQHALPARCSGCNNAGTMIGENIMEGCIHERIFLS